MLMLLSFSPVSVQGWNFFPSEYAHAQEVHPTAFPSDSLFELVAASKIVSQGDHVLKDTLYLKDDRQRERLAKHFQNMREDIPEGYERAGDATAALFPFQQTTLSHAPEIFRSATSETVHSMVSSPIPRAEGNKARFIIAKARTIRGRPKTLGAVSDIVDDTLKNESLSDSTMVQEPDAAPAVESPSFSVEDGRALLASGDYASGTAILLALVDRPEGSDTRIEADYSVRLLWREASSGSLSEEQLDAIEAALPSWGSLTTPESANQVMLFSYLRAERFSKAGNDAAATEYFVQAQHQAADIDCFPESPVLVRTVQLYVDASCRLTEEEKRNALDWCLAKAMDKKRAHGVCTSLSHCAGNLYPVSGPYECNHSPHGCNS